MRSSRRLPLRFGGRGFDRLSVAEVARAAGLTHGALYSHFQSKDALAAEATKRAFDDCLRDFTGLTATEFLQQYLSTRHRDDPEEGCPTAALASEIPRQPAESQAAFRNGIEGFIALADESLETVGAEHGHDRAVLMFAAMVGALPCRALYGMSISRALPTFCGPSATSCGSFCPCLANASLV